MSELEEENNVRGIIIHPDLINKKVIDIKGRVWMLEDLKNQPPDSLIKDMLFTKRVGSTVDKEVLDNITSAAGAIFKSYIENDFKKVLDGAVASLDPLIKQCQSDAEARFKKSFVEAMAKKSRDAFTALLAEQFVKIGEAFKKEEVLEVKINSTGVMPPGVRLKWNAVVKGYTVNLFLIEQPPQIRAVKFNGSFYRLAFPWLRFYVLFSNGNYAGFWAFYGKECITSENSSIFRPGLPHFSIQRPYGFCLGSIANVIKIESDWWRIIIDEYFWNKEFLPGGNPGYSENWGEVCAKIPEIANFENWEKLSRENPEKVLSLPWFDFGKTVGGFGIEIINWYGERVGILPRSRQPELKALENNIVNLFNEKITEEIHFMTDNFIFNSEFQKLASQFSEERVKACKEQFVNSLRDNCEAISREVIKRCLSIQEGEGANPVEGSA